MPPERIERRLAAILAADVAGYSRLMGADEEGTLARLNGHRREQIDPKIAEHRGRVVKTTGDGILIEFPSVVDAVRCAIEVQRAMAESNADLQQQTRIEFRIGINLGDVLVEGDDIHGDGVNIAARLEGIADPGGICISDPSYQQVRDKLDLSFEDLGERHLKNIARPMRVYRVRAEGRPAMAKSALDLPDKPSIAVLPFQNMSGDPEQDYFADGIVEEIITALSRFRNLFVIARNSSFTYKGRAVDVKQAGRELGVRYVLEGSVRKAVSRVRITAQLIEAATGSHLWADRFDGSLEDVFDLQDQVTAKVVGAIAPTLEQAEIERAGRKPTGSYDAYDYFLRGVASVHLSTDASVAEALRLLSKAVELDPQFASAYGMAAYCYDRRKADGWMVNAVFETAEAARLARRAAELGKNDAVALCFGGIALAYVVGDLADGISMIDRALVLNPNLAAAWNFSGWARAFFGEPELAIEHLARAMRLSPLDPMTFNMHGGTAFAHFLAGHDEEALVWAERALRERPNYVSAMRVLTAGYASTGRPAEARAMLERLLRLDPALRVSTLKDLLPLRRPEDLARFVESLRLAGLAE